MEQPFPPPNRLLRAFPSPSSPPPFLVVCPTGTAHAPVLAAALLLDRFDWTVEEDGWVLRPSSSSDKEEAAAEAVYLPSEYHRTRRLGPLNARPALPRLAGLPRLREKGIMRRALASVQRAMGEAGVAPPPRALQKELWSLFSGDTSGCCGVGPAEG